MDRPNRPSSQVDHTPNWSNAEMLYPGVWVYRNVIKDHVNVINRVNALIDENEKINWQDAQVGYSDTIPNYRNCKDIKFGYTPTPRDKAEQMYADIWLDLYKAQVPSVADYCSKYNLQMDYWELMNFIKYVPGDHFKEHADHGFSYMATVSLVAYPNDDYEGGNLYFPKIKLDIKPQAGDLYIFPSTYLFSHVAQPVTSGTKYSLVTMLDYNDHAHNEEFYIMRNKRMKDVSNRSI